MQGLDGLAPSAVWIPPTYTDCGKAHDRHWRVWGSNAGLDTFRCGWWCQCFVKFDLLSSKITFEKNGLNLDNKLRK